MKYTIYNVYHILNISTELNNILKFNNNNNI